MPRRPYRRVALPAAAGILMLSLAAPALAAPAHGAARPAAALLAVRSPQAAIPSPAARYSGAVVPGITGAAAQQAGPAAPGPQRPAQPQASGQASQAAATPGVAGTLAPGLAAWTGTLHGGWGISPDQTIYGAQATQSLNPQLTVPSGDPEVLYLPTLDPSGIDCIEMSTLYFGGIVQVSAWDWCKGTGDWGKLVSAVPGSSFLATYAAKSGGHYFYSVRDMQTNPATNAWTAYLYNYKTKAWDTFYTSASTSKLSQSGGRWDMDEVYASYDTKTAEGSYCTPTAGSLWSTTGLEYQLSSGGPWTAATSADSHPFSAYPDGASLGCADLSFALTSNGFAVTNASRPAAEIINTETGSCIDTANAKFANGTSEGIETCHGGPGQKWAYNAGGHLTVDGGKYCLSTSGNGTVSGTKVDLWACVNAPGQQWTFGVHGTLVGEESGLCLQPADAVKGSQLVLETCGTSASQQW